jgi:hypothetical protein
VFEGLTNVSPQHSECVCVCVCVCVSGNGCPLLFCGLLILVLFALAAEWKGAKGRDREIHLRCYKVLDVPPALLASRGSKWMLCSWSILGQNQKT